MIGEKRARARIDEDRCIEGQRQQDGSQPGSRQALDKGRGRPVNGGYLAAESGQEEPGEEDAEGVEHGGDGVEPKGGKDDQQEPGSPVVLAGEGNPQDEGQQAEEGHEGITAGGG